SGRPRCPGRRSSLAAQVVEDLATVETVSDRQLPQVDGRRPGDPAAVPENIQRGSRVGHQPRDCAAVVGDREGLSRLDAAEDLRAVVPELPVRDRAHGPSCDEFDRVRPRLCSTVYPGTLRQGTWTPPAPPPPLIIESSIWTAAPHRKRSIGRSRMTTAAPAGATLVRERSRPEGRGRAIPTSGETHR